MCVNTHMKYAMPSATLRNHVRSCPWHLLAARHAHHAHASPATQGWQARRTRSRPRLGQQHLRFASSPLAPCADDAVNRCVNGLHRHNPPDSRARHVGNRVDTHAPPQRSALGLGHLGEAARLEQQGQQLAASRACRAHTRLPRRRAHAVGSCVRGLCARRSCATLQPRIVTCRQPCCHARGSPPAIWMRRYLRCRWRPRAWSVHRSR